MNEYPSWTDLGRTHLGRTDPDRTHRSRTDVGRTDVGRTDLGRTAHPAGSDSTAWIDVTTDTDVGSVVGGTTVADHLTVVTPVRDERDLEHLRAQLWGLGRQHRPADRHVIVRMDGPPVTDTLIAAGADLTTITVVEVPRGASTPSGTSTPVARAAARDLGLRHAASDGLAVLLDPACIPSPELLWHTARACQATGSVVTGPVVDLPVIPLSGPSDLLLLASYGPIDRRADDGEVTLEDRRELPWPGSVAAPTALLRRVATVEDDLVARVAAVGGRLYHVGGATTYRQSRLPSRLGRANHGPISDDTRDVRNDTTGDVAATTTTAGR